jgi:hypothetical protein
MEKMLDAGFWILDFKGNYPYFIQHQASSIQYLPTLTGLGHCDKIILFEG